MHTVINEAICIRLHAVRDSRLPVVVDSALSENLAGGTAIAQSLRGDRVQVSVRDGFPIQSLSIRGQCDTIGAEIQVGEWQARLSAVYDFAPQVLYVLLFDVYGVVAVEMAPSLAGAKVGHYNTIAALGGGIGDVCDALAGGAGEVGAQVEANVVEVRVWVCDGRGEEDCLKDGVVREVYAD